MTFLLQICYIYYHILKILYNTFYYEIYLPNLSPDFNLLHFWPLLWINLYLSFKYIRLCPNVKFLFVLNFFALNCKGYFLYIFLYKNFFKLLRFRNLYIISLGFFHFLKTYFDFWWRFLLYGFFYFRYTRSYYFGKLWFFFINFYFNATCISLPTISVIKCCTGIICITIKTVD